MHVAENQKKLPMDALCSSAIGFNFHRIMQEQEMQSNLNFSTANKLTCRREIFSFFASSLDRFFISTEKGMVCPRTKALLPILNVNP
jgi:hypothetical protein